MHNFKNNYKIDKITLASTLKCIFDETYPKLFLNYLIQRYLLNIEEFIHEYHQLKLIVYLAELVLIQIIIVTCS